MAGCPFGFDRFLYFATTLFQKDTVEMKTVEQFLPKERLYLGFFY